MPASFDKGLAVRAPTREVGGQCPGAALFGGRHFW